MSAPRSSPPPARSRAAAADDSDDDEATSSSAKAPAGPYRTDPKGDEFKAAGEKKLKSFGFFSGNAKYEEAIEYFEKAAAQYKMNKNWNEAGDMYLRTAEIYKTNLKEIHDQGVAYENAAKAFKNVNTKEAIRCYTLCSEVLMENNKFSMGAKVFKEMAGLQEKEHDIKGALTAYTKAADCYDADNATSNANAMWVKVAGLHAEAGEYKKAIQLYEKVSKSSLESSALRWSVKGYLFKALLCQFALAAQTQRTDTVTSKLEQYVDMCPDLDGSREKGLIEDLVEDFNERDADKFTDHIMVFDEIVKLDNWTSSILLQIKKALEEGNEEDNQVGV